METEWMEGEREHYEEKKRSDTIAEAKEIKQEKKRKEKKEARE